MAMPDSSDAVSYAQAQQPSLPAADSCSGSAVRHDAGLRVTRRVRSSERIPALDGVRGVAILIVMASHLSEQFSFTNHTLGHARAVLFAGWTGVDLFFVLSGFLITGILLDAKGSHGYFRNFYARRTLRIFPLYYVTLLIFLVIAPAIAPRHGGWQPLHYPLARHCWIWFCAYLTDVLVAWKGFLIGGHFWTLAVEEHFYLVWPFLVYRLSSRGLAWACLVLILAATVLRAGLSLGGVSTTAIYVLTPCRMDGLALGAFLAIAVRQPEGLRTLLRVARMVCPLAAVLWVGIMLWDHGWIQYGLVPQTLGYAVTEVFYGCLLVFTLAWKNLADAMAAAPLRFLGKISYALYVFHPFVVFLLAPAFALGAVDHASAVSVWLGHLFGGTAGLPVLVLDGLVFVVLATGLSVGAAVVSWYALEAPCLRLRRLFPYTKRSAPAIA